MKWYMKHVLYSKILIKVWTYVREEIIIMPDFHYNVWIYTNIQLINWKLKKSIQVWNEFLNKINDTNRKVQNSKYISPTDRWTESVCMQKRHNGRQKFQGWRHPFSSLELLEWNGFKWIVKKNVILSCVPMLKDW